MRAPTEIKAIWSNTGYYATVRHFAAQMGWKAASDRLLAIYRRNPSALTRLHNWLVRTSIKSKIAAGHPHIVRIIGSVPHVALDYGPGRCSSSFVIA